MFVGQFRPEKHMALTHYERTKRYRMRKAGQPLPPTPKQEAAAEIKRIMAEHHIGRRAAYYRLERAQSKQRTK
jgi:hypothetical protein